MSRSHLATGLALLLMSAAATVHAQEDEAAAEGDAGAEAEPVEIDPLTARMLVLVHAYYTGIGSEPSPSERENALESMRLMLLDGVSLGRIEDALARAVNLHTPGRRIPFEIAVPLRIRSIQADKPADLGSWTEPPSVQPLEPEEEARRARKREEAELQRSRLRLYRQWRERTAAKRTLLNVGIPVLASSYALGWASAGIASLQGSVPYYSAWVTAIPVVGTLVLGIWLEGQAPQLYLLTGLQLAGVALVAAGAALKVDWPYERDPLALRIGRRPRTGNAALTIRPVPTGAGGTLVGEF